MNNSKHLFYRGNIKSDITFIEISDLECEKCLENRKLMEYFYKKYKGKVRFGFSNYCSYNSISALATLAAAKQNKFWEMREIFVNSNKLLTLKEVVEFASTLNLNLKKFKNDLSNPSIVNELEENFKYLRNNGIDATPTIIINGRLIHDSFSKNEIEKVLLEEMGL